jgi:hypothetical protein
VNAVMARGEWSQDNYKRMVRKQGTARNDNTAFIQTGVRSSYFFSRALPTVYAKLGAQSNTP